MNRIITILITILGITAAAIYLPPHSIEYSNSFLSLQVSAGPNEIVEARTQTSKTTYISGTTYALDASISPIHYKDVNGYWQDIDNAFTNNVMSADQMTVRILQQTFNQGQIMEFAKGSQYVRLQPMALEWVNSVNGTQQISMPQAVVGTVTNNETNLLARKPDIVSHTGTISWDNAYGNGIDFKWFCAPGRLGKVITINSFKDLPAPASYISSRSPVDLRFNMIFAPSSGIDIYVDGKLWNKSTTVQTFNRIAFKSGATTLWEFKKLFYWDSPYWNSEDDFHYSDYQQSVATLRKGGSNLYIEVRVPYTWLQQANYPVFIDTDVDAQVGAGADDGFVEADTPQFDNDYVILRIGNISGNDYNIWARFTGITISSGATIDDSYVEFYKDGQWNQTYGSIAANDVASPTAPADADDWYNLAYTTASESMTDWGGGSGWKASPDISTVIQELVDSYSYSSGAIMILANDAGSDADARSAILSYDYSDGSYAPKLHITYTTSSTYDITNDPSTKAFGIVADSTSYYAKGTAPNNPVVDGDCTYTLTSTGTGTTDVDIHSHNATGGVGATLTASAPGSNTFRITAYYTGQNPASGDVLTTSDQEFYDNLASSGHIHWDFKFEMGTATDGVQKSTTITVTGRAHS